MKISKVVFYTFFLALSAFLGCISTDSDLDEEIEISLIPKEYDTKGKVVSKKESPYSCLVSTLSNEETDYNYWNKSFWIHIPKSMLKPETEEETVLEVFVYGDKDAGIKSGSFGEFPGIVRIAQCEIPDSEEIREKLDKKFRKFGNKSWLDGKKQKQLTSESQAPIMANGEWTYTCSKFFITIVCDSNSCTVSEIRCIRWDVEYEDDGYSGGGGGDDGFPSEDPGACDPAGSEPCFDEGGGSTPPPNPDDPCEAPNPEPWCSCEDTGDDILDNQGFKEKSYELLQTGNAFNANSYNRIEQGGFITQNPSGELGFVPFDVNSWTFESCKMNYSNPFIPSNTVAVTHSHPFEIGEKMYPCATTEADKNMILQISPNAFDEYTYKGAPTDEDKQLLELVKSTISNPNVKAYIVDKNGITEFDENSSTTDLQGSERHNRTCYQN